MFKNSYGEYDAELVRIAMHFASSLTGNYGYTTDDADDILQTLLLTGIAALQKYDASKSKRSTFLYIALRARVLKLAREGMREKRDKRREAFSLNDEWPGDSSGDTQLHEVYSVQDTLSENGGSKKDHTDFQSLRIDMQLALEALPQHLQKLCLLHSHLDSEDARRAAGMAYSTHHRAIKRIKAHLERCGVGPKIQEKSGRDRASAGNNSTPHQ